MKHNLYIQYRMMMKLLMMHQMNQYHVYDSVQQIIYLLLHHGIIPLHVMNIKLIIIKIITNYQQQ
jgi:thiosulfate reductase cytochrome b subunit